VTQTGERYHLTVPRTRRTVGREEKVAEVVGAAVARLESGGFEALSVAGVARDLGVAQNAIYWYFPTRDHLFVAAMDKLVGRIVDHKVDHLGSVVDAVLWFVDRLDASQGVMTSLYVRARTSPVVAEYEAAFRARMNEMLVEALRVRVPEDDVQEVATTLRCAIDGALLRGMPRAERDRVIRRAFDRLVG
jgi:AcrR family transcriptional regulator